METQDGSLYSTEARGCPRGQLPAELRAAAPREDPARLFSCASLRPLGDVGVHGQLDPHGFPGTAPRVRVGKHRRKMRGDKGQGPCLVGPDVPRAPLSPGRGARAAPAPPAEGPACPRAAPPPPCLCACRGAEEELEKSFGLKNPPFCCQPSPTSGAAVRCAGLRTRPPHKGSSSALLRSAPQVSAAPPPTALGSGPHPRAPGTAAPPARRRGHGHPGPGERRPPVTSRGGGSHPG